MTKTDVQVQIQVTIKLKKRVDWQNLQVKLVSNKNGFNQIDKKWVDNYQKLWKFNDDLCQLFKYFTGELKPFTADSRDKIRMFVDEFSNNQQNRIINFLEKNKSLIITDLLQGRDNFRPHWMLVILKEKQNYLNWALKPMHYVLNLYNGPVKITKKGSINIGKITMQRKGGDAGRKSSNMMQFKINPCLLFND